MLLTPFDGSGRILWADLKRLIAYELKLGIHGLAALGLGGEASRLDKNERISIAECVLQEVGGCVPTIIGVSASDTDTSCSLARHAADHGAACVMAAPLSIPGVTRMELHRHYLAVASAAEPTQVMVQDAPAYLNVALDSQFMLDLAQERPNVRYAKIEAVPAGERVADLVSAAGDALAVFGGQAGLYYLSILDAGAVGVIPGCDCAEELVAIFQAHGAGRRDEAAELYRHILPLIVFEIQTLDFFIACSKELLRRKGILSSAAMRAPSPLGPWSYDALGHYALSLSAFRSCRCEG